MSKINSRLKEYAEIMIGQSLSTTNELKHSVPSMFDGSIDLYISWLKHLKKIADEHCVEVTMSLSGLIKTKRKY